MQTLTNQLKTAQDAAVDSTLTECLEDFGWSGEGFVDGAVADPAGLHKALAEAFPYAIGMYM